MSNFLRIKLIEHNTRKSEVELKRVHSQPIILACLYRYSESNVTHFCDKLDRRILKYSMLIIAQSTVFAKIVWYLDFIVQMDSRTHRKKTPIRAVLSQIRKVSWFTYLVSNIECFISCFRKYLTNRHFCCRRFRAFFFTNCILNYYNCVRCYVVS